MVYRTCPYCGASLDPEEKCDCRDNEEEPAGGNQTGSDK